MPQTSTPTAESIRAVLREHGQEHLLRFLDELSVDEQQALIEQIASFDFTALAPHLRGDHHGLIIAPARSVMLLREIRLLPDVVLQLEGRIAHHRRHDP